MTNYELRPALDALKKINLSLIKEQKMKNRLFELSLELLSADRALQQKREDIRTVVFGPVQSSVDEVNRLIYQMNNESDVVKKKALQDELNSHKELLEPNYEFTQKIEKLMKEEFAVKPIKKDSFVAAISELDGIDLGVLEGLFPILS